MNPNVLANVFDTKYILATLQSWFEGFPAAMMRRCTVSSVDPTTKTASVTFLDSSTAHALFSDYVPSVGEYWWTMRSSKGDWIIYDKAV